MPRDGSHQYHVPPGTPGIPDTPVASTPYNAFLSDLEADLNLPRPIEVGGSGASSADGALDNLSAEKFKMVVTNWDTNVWRAGSFYATTAATGISPIGTVPPTTAHAFAGIAYYANATDFVVEATDLTTGTKYIRYMTAGVWGAWAAINAAVADALYVKKAGDTMTGPLALPAAAPTLGPQATNKTYVDAGDAAAMTAINDALTTKAVRYDIAQALTAAQQVQARQNIYAAPFDAMAFSGMQINGSMDVTQERAAGQVIATGYICDGWKLSSGGSMVLQGYLSGPLLPGFSNFLAVAVTTAQASLGATDYVVVAHPIEGYRIERLAFGSASAQPITIAFWSAHHRTGVYTGVIRNGANTRSYAFSYTQAAADVAQYNTVTIPGDVAGAWTADNSVGFSVIFAVAAGATLTAPSLNGWLAGNYVAGPGQVNAVAATSDMFRITGVIVLPGIEAPSAARSPLIMRPFDQELILCKRYFQKLGGSQSNDMFIAGDARLAGVLLLQTLSIPVELRANPTMTFPGNWTANNCGAAATGGVGMRSLNWYVVATAAGSVSYNNADATGHIKLDARL